MLGLSKQGFKDQCLHSFFFWVSIIVNEERTSAASGGRMEKKCSTQHLFFWALYLFSAAALSTLSNSTFTISKLSRKALVKSTALLSRSGKLLCCLVVSASGRSVRTWRWRSRCWSSPCTHSCTICQTKTIITVREKPVCVLGLFMSCTHILRDQHLFATAVRIIIKLIIHTGYEGKDPLFDAHLW